MVGMKSIVVQNQIPTLFIVCLIFISLPFLFVRFIPSTDLPQHLAQIRLLQDVLKNPTQREYVVGWAGANTLVYYLLDMNWMIFPPILAGKMMVLEIVMAWIVGIFALARRKNCSPFSAALACILVFNASLTWGFLNFLIGLPIFILWFLLIMDRKKTRPIVTKIVLIISISFLLFFAHALWLLLAVVHFFVATLCRRPTLKEIGIRCAALAPVGFYSAFWFPRLSAIRATIGFDTAAHWIVSPLERMHPRWLLESLLGGIHGPTEALVLGGIAVWIGMSLITNWGKLRTLVEKEFLFVGILLTLVVFCAPDKYMNTIYFASRWAPAAMIFFLLALPLPQMQKSVLAFYTIFLLAILSLTTCWYWWRFEKTENSGLSESLMRIHDNSRVLGLDFVQESEFICGRPFLQTFAYAQVLHGGKLNFSFAEHYSELVSFAQIKRVRIWTPGLEWYPQRVSPSDINCFDYALINGLDNAHNFFASYSMLMPLTTTGRWRLYQCVRDTLALQHGSQTIAR